MVLSLLSFTRNNPRRGHGHVVMLIALPNYNTMFSGGKTSTPSNDGTSTVPSNVYLLVSSPAPHEDVLCKSVLYLTSNNHHLLAPFHYISERCILLLCNICVRTNVCRRIHCQITSSEFTTYVVSQHCIIITITLIISHYLSFPPRCSVTPLQW